MIRLRDLLLSLRLVLLLLTTFVPLQDLGTTLNDFLGSRLIHALVVLDRRVSGLSCEELAHGHHWTELDDTGETLG